MQGSASAGGQHETSGRHERERLPSAREEPRTLRVVRQSHLLAADADQRATVRSLGRLGRAAVVSGLQIRSSTTERTNSRAPRSKTFWQLWPVCSCCWPPWVY